MKQKCKKKNDTKNASVLKVEDFLLPGNSETEMIDYSSSIYSLSDIFSLEAPNQRHNVQKNVTGQFI